MCLYPTLIKNRKYTSTKKNGGIIPPLTDLRKEYVPIGCGDCIECRKQKARNWQIRLLEDLKTHKNGKFVTLTFNNKQYAKLIEHDRVKNLEGYQRDNQLATVAVRYFMERWRKKYGKTLRHWLITELGHKGTENIHLHGIIWTNEPLETVEQIWQYGWMWKGKETNNNINKLQNYVNEKTVNYIIKYITKKDNQHSTYKSITLTSPGIGKNYINTKDAKNNRYNDNDTNQTYRTRTGHKMALPIYYRNKIYTEEQREELWTQTLDKQERWIMGEKIDISQNEKEYYATLKYYQKLNRQLGFGNGQKTWEQVQYETQRRNLMNETRKKLGQRSDPSFIKGKKVIIEIYKSTKNNNNEQNN